MLRNFVTNPNTRFWLNALVVIAQVRIALIGAKLGEYIAIGILCKAVVVQNGREHVWSKANERPKTYFQIITTTQAIPCVTLP